ncbi:MAG: hypothetical protein Q9209_000409 [Squamulea sp. 1 TL-2023]
MLHSHPPRVKLPDTTPPKRIHPGPNSWAGQNHTKTPRATNRDKYENKPMPPTPDASPSPIEKPLTARKDRPYIQPATPLILLNQINPGTNNRRTTDSAVPTPLFTSKTSSSTVDQLRKKYSQTRNKSKSTKDEEDIMDRPTSPPLVVSQKASQILGVFPTENVNRENAPTSAPPSTNTPDSFRKSAGSTKVPNTSLSRQVKSTPVLTRRYLQENHLPVGANTRTSEELEEATATSSNEKRQHQSTEGTIVGSGPLNPTRLGTLGRTGEVGYVGQNEIHRVLSFTGVIEDAAPLDINEDGMEPDTNKTGRHQNTLHPQYSGDILHPIVYSPSNYAGVWENDPNVVSESLLTKRKGFAVMVCQGHTLPPFSPYCARPPPLPPSEVDQHSFSHASGDVPIVLQKYPGESSHGSGYTHSLRSQNSWAPSGNGSSFAQVNAPSSATETTPRFPIHTRDNSAPAPPMSYPGFQPSETLPPGLVQMELNLHHHIESCYGSLMRLTTDNTDRIIDKMVRRAEQSQELIEKGLKVLRSEMKDLGKEVSGMRKGLADASQADNRMNNSISLMVKKLNVLDERIGEIGTRIRPAATEASESEQEESSTYSQGNGSPRRRSRSTHASASSRQGYRQPYASGITSGSASTQQSVISNRIRRSNTNSSGGALRRSDERGGKKEASAQSPDIRDHPAYRGVIEAPGPSSPIYQTPNYGETWYQQAYGHP